MSTAGYALLLAEQERLRQVRDGADRDTVAGRADRYQAEQDLKEIDALLAASGEGSRPSLTVLPGRKS